MHTNRFSLATLPTWILLILWVASIVLLAIPDRTSEHNRDSATFRHDIASIFDDALEAMPVFMVQDCRKTGSVRLDPSSSKSRHHDLKKHYAALASLAPTLAAVPQRFPQETVFQSVPESVYGFSFSSRSPPLAV